MAPENTESVGIHKNEEKTTTRAVKEKIKNKNNTKKYKLKTEKRVKTAKHKKDLFNNFVVDVCMNAVCVFVFMYTTYE